MIRINQSKKNVFKIKSLPKKCAGRAKGTGFKKSMVLLIAGLGVGFINGFFGGGGGMIVVPVLTYIVGMPVKKAHATALFIILPITVISCVAYLQRVSVDVTVTSLVALGSIVGGLLGANLLKKASNIFLQVFFALFMVATGLYMFLSASF